MDYQWVNDGETTTLVPVAMVAAARREGMIAGLERAGTIVARWPFPHIVDEIHAEIARLIREQA